MRCEYLVCRVLLHMGPWVSSEVRERARAAVLAGEWACLDDGAIAEAVASYADQMEADAERERRAAGGGDWRVVLVGVLDSGELS